MYELPLPIKDVLRDYCHVEWYEVEELIEEVRSARHELDVSALKNQFEQLIQSSEGVRVAINKITANQFETDEEARAWLEDIYNSVFE